MIAVPTLKVPVTVPIPLILNAVPTTLSSPPVPVETDPSAIKYWLDVPPLLTNLIAVIIPALAVIAIPTFNVSPIVPIPLIDKAVPTILSLLPPVESSHCTRPAPSLVNTWPSVPLAVG